MYMFTEKIPWKESIERMKQEREEACSAFERVPGVGNPVYMW